MNIKHLMGSARLDQPFELTTEVHGCGVRLRPETEQASCDEGGCSKSAAKLRRCFQSEKSGTGLEPVAGMKLSNDSFGTCGEPEMAGAAMALHSCDAECPDLSADDGGFQRTVQVWNSLPKEDRDAIARLLASGKLNACLGVE